MVRTPFGCTPRYGPSRHGIGRRKKKIKLGHYHLLHPCPTHPTPGIKCPDDGRMNGAVMKIVVIGGTGLIGSKLVNKLREQSHEAIAAAPNTRINTLTGEKL